MCSEYGPPSPTTRLVLLALATHFGKDGKAWPSVNTLAIETASGVRTVFEGLKDGESRGWIKRQQVHDPQRGKAWRRTVYTFTLPTAPAAPPSRQGSAPAAQPTPQIDVKAERKPEGAADSAHGAAFGADRAAADSSLVLRQPHTNNDLNIDMNNKGSIKSFPPASPPEPIPLVLKEKVKAGTAQESAEYTKTLDAQGEKMQLPRNQGERNGEYALRIMRRTLEGTSQAAAAGAQS